MIGFAGSRASSWKTASHGSFDAISPPCIERAAPGRGTAGATRKRGPGPGVELESRMFARSSAVSRTLFGIWAVIAAFLLPVRAGAEEEEEREHFQLKLSPSYDEGGFGTSETSCSYDVPLT